jgi:hypothetical protein
MAHLTERVFIPVVPNRRLNGTAGLELLGPAANDLLQRWLVSKRVNSPRASDEEPTLIDSVG